MLAQNLFEGIVQQVSGRMVVGGRLTAHRIDLGAERGCEILRQTLRDMYYKTVLLFGSHYGDALAAVIDKSGIADLTARIAVERRAVEDQLICRLALALDTAVARYAYLRAERIVADELAAVDRQQLLPVVDILRSGVARTLLLALQLLLESLDIHIDALLAGDKLRQVDRESERIV